MHQDDGICASATRIAAGRQLSLLILREAITRIRADEQPVRSRTAAGSSAIIRQSVNAMEAKIHPHHRPEGNEYEDAQESS